MIIKTEVLYSHDYVYIKKGCLSTALGGYQVLPQKLNQKRFY